MNDFNNWAESQHRRLNRINDLLNEIIESHRKMQSLLTEAMIKNQAERGLKDIENYLRQPDQ